MYLLRAISNCLPLRFFAIIIPFLFIRILLGMLLILYFLAVGECQPLSSLTWFFQLRLSFFIAFFQLDFLLSREKLYMVNSLVFLNLLYTDTKCLFSFLQGLHHEAQKSISTYLPRKELRFMILLLMKTQIYLRP